MAVLKYFKKIQELSTYDTITYTPKRGEKKEVFSATNQLGYKKFTKAIIHKTNPNAKLKVTIDRTRPKGSRMVLVDTRRESLQRYYEIPAKPIIEASLEAEKNGDDPEEYIREVLEQYAEDAEFYLIRSGDYFIWKGADGLGYTADKLAELMQNYGAQYFDPHDKNSSYFHNWFRGITAFTSRFDAHEHIKEAATREARYREKAGYKFHERHDKERILRDGSTAKFRQGKFVEIITETKRRKSPIKSNKPKRTR